MDFSLEPAVVEWIAKADALLPIFAERARAIDEAGSWPQANMEMLRDQGFLSLAVPAEFGGRGTAAGFSSLLVHSVIERIASACGSTAWALTTQYHCHGLIAGLADRDQQEWLFKEVIENGALMATVGSEVVPQVRPRPDVPVDFKFNADLTRSETGFLATGTKGFSSMAAASDFILFWAVAPGAQTASEGMVLAVLDARDPGIHHLPGWGDAIGIRASLSGPTRFEDVPVELNHILGRPGGFIQDHPYLFELSYATIILGAAQGVFNFLVRSLQERPSLLDEDALKYTLGEMSSALQATRTSWWYAQWLYDQRRFSDAARATLRASHQAKAAGIAVATSAFDVIGTRALFKFNPVERAWRDIRTVSLHTRESQLMSLLAKAEIEGTMFPKAKYGYELEPGERKSWTDLGIPELDGEL